MIYRRPYVPDQRKFQRYDCNITVLCKVQEPQDLREQFADREFELTALNICKEGVGLISDYQIPKYSLLSLILVMFKGNSSGVIRVQRPLEVKGRVCYSQPTGEANKYRLGVCFTEIPCEYPQRLANFLSVPA